MLASSVDVICSAVTVELMFALTAVKVAVAVTFRPVTVVPEVIAASATISSVE